MRRMSPWRGSKYVPRPRFQAFLAEHALFRAEPFAVEHFSLVASYLTKSGAIYEDQADYPLSEFDIKASRQLCFDACAPPLRSTPMSPPRFSACARRATRASRKS